MGKAGKLRRWVLRLVIFPPNKSLNDSLLMSSAINRHVSNRLVDSYDVASSPSCLESIEPIQRGRVDVYVDKDLHTPRCHVMGRLSQFIVKSHVALQRWRPTPRGHVVVYVGKEGERFLVPIAYLTHPLLEELLQMSATEFGYAHRAGLRIPSSPSLFQRTLALIHTEHSFNNKNKITPF